MECIIMKNIITIISMIIMRFKEFIYKKFIIFEINYNIYIFFKNFR